MKHKLATALGLINFVMSVLITGMVDAQTVAAGPYYANPSWDQTLACATLANCPRFIVLSNMNSDAVLDRETGLVWEKSPSTSDLTWLLAQSHCNALSKGNRKGWRVPTLQELESLMDPSVSPALPTGHPFGIVTPSIYWSATTSASAANGAWLVFLANGDAVVGDKSSQVFVWCVRGGQGVNPQ